MQELPIDISTFSIMIKEEYLYVDKTELIYNLFKKGKRYFFFSRPRRFGKSLLISTLKELFLGKKELFKDLWIGKHSNYQWIEHPVIHLDLSDADSETAQELKISLGQMLDDVAEDYNIDISKRASPKAKLKLLVKKLAVKNRVVILIDEYDKPILDHLHNPERADLHRSALKNFYDGFKGLDAYLRAVFITGVSKFSKTSIFSGLNNLNDISYEVEGAQLAGYTETELVSYFADYIEAFAKEEALDKEHLLEKIKYWYDGYQFSEEPIKLYNPFSIIHLFDRKKFKNFWFQTGTPSFLVECLKNRPDELKEIEKRVFNIENFGTYRLDKIPQVTLFYQAGYLSIKEYDTQLNLYRLGYPNEEVKQSLSLLELCVLTNSEIEHLPNVLSQLKLTLEHKDINSFMLALRSLIGSIPFNLHIETEAYYHSLFQLLCNVHNIDNYAEIATSKGKIDLVLTTDKYVYIFEIKLNKSGKHALNQINNKLYYERYLATSKEIILVGVSFNIKNKMLSLDWVTDAPRNIVRKVTHEKTY